MKNPALPAPKAPPFPEPGREGPQTNESRPSNHASPRARYAHILLAFTVCALASCDSSRGAEAENSVAASRTIDSATLVLDTIVSGRPIATFGWRDLSSSEVPLTERQRDYGAGMLGNVAGVVEAPSGEVYVLDRGWQKIAVFDAAGSFLRLILGGHGSGPGEFQRVRRLALTPDGDIGVLDEALNRVTVFSASTADVVTMITLDGRLPLDLAFDEESVWVLHASYVPGAQVLSRYDLGTGELLANTGLVEGLLSEFMSHGEAGAITMRPDGRLLWALPMTGLLRIIAPEDEAFLGEAIFPEAAPAVNTTPAGVPVRSVPIGVRHVHQSETATVLYHFRRMDNGEASDREFLLSVLPSVPSRQARHYSFGSERHWAAGFGLSADGAHMFVAYSDPFPHVQRIPVPD